MIIGENVELLASTGVAHIAVSVIVCSIGKGSIARVTVVVVVGSQVAGGRDDGKGRPAVTVLVM